MGLPLRASQDQLRIVPKVQKSVKPTIGFYGDIDIFSSLGVTPISQTKVFQSIEELTKTPPEMLMIGVHLNDNYFQLHSEVQKVLQLCAKRGIDVLYLKEGNYQKILPGMDRLTIGGERNISPNELPMALEVMEKLRAGFQTGVFTLDQVLSFNKNESGN